MFTPWWVYSIRLSNITPPHVKHCVYLCNEHAPLFFFINSERRFHGIGQVELFAGEHEVLEHDSFLDLSGLKQPLHRDLVNAQDRGQLSREIRTRAEAALRLGIQTLPERHRSIALETIDF
jgi:hypothetical protein